MHRKVVITALTLALAVAASADPRNKITYQGALRDAGAPFDGTVDLLFRIYDAETDGSIIVPFLFQQVQVVDGRFTVELDFSSQAADLSEPTWIEIAVSTDSSIFTTLTPRQPLTSTAFSLNTRGLDVDPAGGVTVGSNLTVDNSAGSGVPVLRATASGGSFFNSQFIFETLGGGQGPNLVLDHQGPGGSRWFLRSNGQSEGGPGSFSIRDVGVGATRMHISPVGYVGLGTTTPQSKLMIRGASELEARLRIDSTSSTEGPSLELRKTTAPGRIWRLRSNGSADGIPAAFSIFDADAGLSRFLIDTAGNVAIGAASPTAKLNIETSNATGIRTQAQTTALDATATSVDGIAIYTELTTPNNIGYALFAKNDSPGGYAVFSNGDLAVTGAKSFVIDHPLDPANKYLTHYCTEAPEPLNVYSGVVRLDHDGKAWVTLPDYFAAINEDFRYQLTAIGAPGPNLYIASEIENDRFQIAGGTPNAKVSWEVKARRADAWIKQHSAQAEQLKPARYRGTYLNPELHGAPPEQGQAYRSEQRTPEVPNTTALGGAQ